MKRYLVIVEDAGSNYSAYSPDVDGCITTGKTIEETLDNMQSALEAHLRITAEYGEEIPEPSSVTAVYLAVAVPAPRTA